MQDPNLIEIRCPIERLGTNGKLYVCNSVCAKLTPGSSGELRCRKCRLTFWAEVDPHARRTTGVLVKKVE